MKVTINSNDLKNALKDLALVKTNKLTMEVLQHYKAEIKDNYLFLSITDLDVEIVRKIDISLSNYSERLEFLIPRIEVQAFNEDKMETTTTINCESNLEEFEIGFHLPYIKEALASSSVENITIELENALSSGAIKEAINDSNRIMVVHPMRL